eukprot:3570998-Rhodomonas_salina.1
MPRFENKRQEMFTFRVFFDPFWVHVGPVQMTTVLGLSSLMRKLDVELLLNLARLGSAVPVKPRV